MEFLLEPLNFEYMRYAILAAGVVGGFCGILSVFLFLKGWALVGDALSHSVLPGVAGAYLLRLPYGLGAFFAGVLSILAIIFLKRWRFFKNDAVTGLVLIVFFSFGVFLISIFPTPINLQAVIYGSIFSIHKQDLLEISGIFVIVSLVILLKWRDFRLAFFDKQQANLVGIYPNLIFAVFFIFLTTAVVFSLQVVGAILTVAIIIIPASIALLWVDNFAKILFTSMMIGIFSSMIGVYASYFLDMHSGALIVVLQGGTFLFSALFSPKKGIILHFLKVNR